MSKKKHKNTNRQKQNNNIRNIGVVHGKSSIYTHKAPTGQHKNSCMYYDKETTKCNNKKCHVSYCTTAHGCTCYKRKEKEVKKRLSDYDENYIQLPTQSGTHERTNEYIAVSRNIGTPCHVGYLKSDGVRRHKARCIYYDKIGKLCKWFLRKCTGSSRCNKYKEKSEQ